MVVFIAIILADYKKTSPDWSKHHERIGSFSANKFPPKAQNCFTSRHVSSCILNPLTDLVSITLITLASSVPLGRTVFVFSTYDTSHLHNLFLYQIRILSPI